MSGKLVAWIISLLQHRDWIGSLGVKPLGLLMGILSLSCCGLSGFGGLIRNSFGSFLGGFYGVKSQASILYAKIMVMLHGLELCWDKRFKHVICFLDSLQTVTLVKNGVSPHHKFANEFFSIHQLLDRDWNVVINHTLREGNACADMLAKMGANTISPLVKLVVPPSELSPHLFADAWGVTFVRE
ncbi:uncharacterized protein LOC123904995 [Trifolium pratense]|uniref:uncharacterized protein LOC123904995 n=1 Tax=Trifolium pratense TaxID=57577 RepID=UPI001E692988|nr:uncharacterized protein LOC123904995 [Trifolium pratense]